MKISFKWLQEYIHLEGSAEEIGELLTSSGLEVEAIEKFETIPGSLKGLMAGEVKECKAHPNADKLKLTKVDIDGEDLLNIVCGAPNINNGQKVVVAPVGSTIYPYDGDPVKINKAKIRGEVSEGMICAEDEIGLGSGHEGILVLNTDLPNGTPAADFFNVESDQIFDIGLTPNRADAISHLGVARDLKALTGEEIKFPSVENFKVDNHDLVIPVEVEDPQGCPRYSGITITKTTIAESPDWLQNKLKSIGLSPINNVVDATNLVLHELGQPLHAFDADKIKGGKVIVKKLPQDSSFITLDEKERKLQDFDLMICDTKEGMCIAGVFGGIQSGINDSTKNIFLESAYFSPDYIRKTAQYHGLKTDASFRFERGTDPRMTVLALKRAAMLIKELTGGSISSDIIDVYPFKIVNFETKVLYQHIDRLIGKTIDRDEIHNILQSLDIEVKDDNAKGFTASIPPYRVDVLREADVIEEILRIHGYDNVEIPSAVGSQYLAEFPELDKNQIQYQLTDFLVANGFNEIITNSLTKPQYVDLVGGLEADSNVVILNRLSEELGVLRQSLLFSGLEVITHNINSQQKDLYFFEFGKTYVKEGDKYRETKHLSLFMTGNIESENWQYKSREIEFYDLSYWVHKILNKFSVINFNSKVVEYPVFDYGMEITVGPQSIVTLGKVKNKLLAPFNLKDKIFFADFDWQQLLKKTKSDFEVKPISKFPEVRRDLSLVIDKKVSFETIKQITKRQENRLLKRVAVFDVYEGKSIGADKKAYALSFILQDNQKTLTDQVIDKAMGKLMKTFEHELGAIIRK